MSVETPSRRTLSRDGIPTYPIRVLETNASPRVFERPRQTHSASVVTP